MNWLNWLIVREKIVIYILYLLLFISVLGYYFVDFRSIFLSYAEILIFTIVGLIGLLQLEIDQSHKLKIWFMLNFTTAFSAMTVSTKSDLIFKDLSFSPVFKFQFLDISITALLAWLCLSLGIFSLSSYFRLRSQWLQTSIMTILLTAFSVWFFIAAGNLNLITINQSTSILIIGIVLFLISLSSASSFVLLKINKPIKMMLHYSMIQFSIFLYLLVVK